MHVDGFRFDLCSTLGRTERGFERDGPFFRAIGQDPVLNQVKLIAEPWDIGRLPRTLCRMERQIPR
jgi:isoamylase